MEEKLRLAVLQSNWLVESLQTLLILDVLKERTGFEIQGPFFPDDIASFDIQAIRKRSGLIEFNPHLILIWLDKLGDTKEWDRPFQYLEYKMPSTPILCIVRDYPNVTDLPFLKNKKRIQIFDPFRHPRPWEALLEKIARLNIKI